ncbi:MAG: class I SAM-dependent rRNA methyltransferase [Anaerolineales bacterium]|nr:class I SAM-dependent rRNA methyltransferase [Anaerolineales bacterium]
MTLVQPHSGPPLQLRLARDLTRSIKRGHPWVYAEALRQLPPAPPGAPALLLDNKKGREIARGFYDPHSPLAFRVCTTAPGEKLNERWAQKRFERALALRRMLFDRRTTGFRMFNGEGDGLPGLVCDIYGDGAVLQLDGAGPSGFWHAPGIAEWLAQALPVKWVYERSRVEGTIVGHSWLGETPSAPVHFLENGVSFAVDVVRGQKTGFFLDQRDNRQKIREVAAGRRVLNGFGYTGGFSIYAGLGGARHVTTVDLAAPALAAAQANWALNDLPPAMHEAVAADAFEFLAEAAGQETFWDLVIVDPPSFAASQAAVPKAIAAYQKLIGAAAGVTAPDGLLAAASCSSHVGLEAFLRACEEGISLARRKATALYLGGQPADHPTPLALPEFRYLKFVLMRVE